MNSQIIKEAAEATLTGTKSFPEIIALLLSAGVEYYHVDYTAMSKSFYGPDGDRVVVPLAYENLPQVAAELDLSGLQAAILDSQINGQKYREFSMRAMSAGVQGYFTFLRGQRVTYLGRTGDSHTEWFPGAKPAES